MTRISIVTVSFNQATFLEQAILSIITQDYPDVEYIVVDPGSTDGSRDLIERYRPRISKVILEPDRGAADGLNRGFAEATGDIFGFINADDLLMPGALRHVAEFFDSNPKCSILMGNGYVVDADRRVRRHIKTTDFTVRRLLYGGTRWLQQSTFFRREAFRNSKGFNIENRTSWDGELFISLVEMGYILGYLNADLGCFRVHDGAISGSSRFEDAYQKDCRRIFRQIMGRDWCLIDEGVRLLYKCEKLPLRSWQWLRSPGERRECV